MISINTLHCLHAYDLEIALKEMERGANHINICVLRVTGMKLKKQTYCIGKLLVKRSIIRRSGSGGLKKQDTLAITLLYTLVIMNSIPRSTRAAILTEQKCPLIVDNIDLRD